MALNHNAQGALDIYLAQPLGLEEDNKKEDTKEEGEEENMAAVVLYVVNQGSAVSAD